MLIVDLTYKVDLEIVNKHVQAHRDFLDKYYKEGVFLVSGPKIPKEGGVIVANVEKSEMEDIIKRDPFYTEGVADFNITCFEPVKRLKIIEDLLQNPIKIDQTPSFC